ncbi:MAG: hypothetical protein RL398_2178 [Planctomycetota bacterium]
MKPRGLRRGNWSVTELERLRELLPRRGVADLARLLRRSPESIARKALAHLRVPARRGPWAPAEDESLRLAWGAVEPRLLGPMLGRSGADVVRRAAELRSQVRTGPWERSELLALKDLYGTRSDEDLEVALARPSAEIAARAAELCLAKDKRFAARAAGRPGTDGDRTRMPRWSVAEVERLRQIYSDADNLEVARALGRTVTSVANKANQLGLKKSSALLAQIGRKNVTLRYEVADAERLVVAAVGQVRPQPVGRDQAAGFAAEA